MGPLPGGPPIYGWKAGPDRNIVSLLLRSDSGSGSFRTLLTKEDFVAKAKDTKKDEKKKPAKTPKEKRAEKRAKRDAK